MKKFSFNSIIRKQQPKFFLSMLFDIGISASASSSATILQKKYFCHENFFLEKVEYLCSFSCLVMVSVPLCYEYLVLYDFLFIKSKVSIGVLEKSYLNIRKHPSWCFKKTTAPKISAYFAYFPVKHPALSSCKPSWDYSKKLYRAAILQAEIHPSSFDVRYLVQKTQSFNWLLKLNLNVYISVCLFAVTF